jgi:ABC-type branched-subunit amino acid transport system substrate-binding protein
LRKRLLKAVVALAVLGLALGAAAASRSSNTKTVPTLHLRAGIVISFTGDLSPYGPSLDAAAKLSGSYINNTLKALHLDKQISVDFVDSQDDQTKIQPAVEGATKLVKVDKVNVVIGTISSGSSIAVAQSVTIPNNVVQITPTSSTPAISFLKDKNLVFRLLPSDTFSALEFVKLLSKTFGNTATINVGNRNDDFGNALANLFNTAWTKQGGKIGKRVSWNPDAPNFDTEAQQLASGNPDGWLIIDFPPTFAKVGPALVRAGGWDPKKTFVGNEMRNADALKAMGAPVTEGLRGTAPSAKTTPARKALDALFKAKVKGKPLTGYEYVAFDSTMIAFLAALEAKSTNPSVFKNYIQKVTNPPGVTANFTQLGKLIKAALAGQDLNYVGVEGSYGLDANGDPSSTFFEEWQVHDGVASTIGTFQLVGGK